MNMLQDMADYLASKVEEIEKVHTEIYKLKEKNKELEYWNKRYKEIINEQRALIIKLKDELNKEHIKQLIKEEDNLL